MSDSIILTPRLLGSGDPSGQALENIITTPLQDGALCYVASGPAKGEWQLDKASSAAPGDDVIVPIGGPGRWVRLVTPSQPVIEYNSGLYNVTFPTDANNRAVVTHLSGPWNEIVDRRVQLPPGVYLLYASTGNFSGNGSGSYGLDSNIAGAQDLMEVSGGFGQFRLTFFGTEISTVFPTFAGFLKPPNGETTSIFTRLKITKIG